MASLITTTPMVPRSTAHLIFRKSAPIALWLAASYLAFIVVWSIASRIIDNPVLLPSFAATVEALFRLIADGTLVPDILASLRRVFIGFFLASIFAVPLAMIMAYIATVRKLVLPIVTLLRPIPPIAWIPIAILWFGIGNSSSYFITALAAFFPIFLNSFAGGLAVEPRHIHAAQFMGVGRTALVTRIYFPSALPHIWTGLKIGLGQSWMAVVTAELIAAQSGLGYMIQINRINLETSAVLVGMVVIGVLGSVMTVALGYLERFVLPWQVR